MAEALDQGGSVTTDDTALFRWYRLAIDGSEVAALRDATRVVRLRPRRRSTRCWPPGSPAPRISTVPGPHARRSCRMTTCTRSCRNWCDRATRQRENGRFRWTEKIAPAMELYHGADPALYGAVAAEIVRCSVDAWMFPEPPRTVPPGTAEPLRAVAGSGFSDQALSTFRTRVRSDPSRGDRAPVDREGSINALATTRRVAMIDRRRQVPVGDVASIVGTVICAVGRGHGGVVDARPYPLASTRSAYAFDAGEEGRRPACACAVGYANGASRRFNCGYRQGADTRCRPRCCWDDRLPGLRGGRQAGGLGGTAVKAARWIPGRCSDRTSLKSDVQAVREAWPADGLTTAGDPMEHDRTWLRRLAAHCARQDS